MATRAQVRGLLEEGHSYETAARELGVPAGLAFMLATGRPADGGRVPDGDELEQGRVPGGSSQQLVNPPPFNPTGKATVLEWVRERAARELR